MTDIERLTAERDSAIVGATALYSALEDLLAQAEHYNESWSVPQFLSDEPAVKAARAALTTHNGAQAKYTTCGICGERVAEFAVVNTVTYCHACDSARQRGNIDDTHGERQPASAHLSRALAEACWPEGRETIL